MAHIKSLCRFSILSAAMFLSLAFVAQSTAGATANRHHASHAVQPRSLEMQGAKDMSQPGQKTVDQDLDTLFARAKANFDKMAASPTLKSSKVKPVNALFWKSLKAHQPWHSLLRTDKKGAVVNEVIRIEGESKEKRSAASEAWFAQVSKTMKEHLNIVKNEKTGRYYLVWAAPILSKVKGTETFQGAVAAQIDLWDCFDRYSDKSTTPFKIHILDRVVLFEHLWRDTIKYAEKHLIVPGIDKISVRYPRMESEAAAAVGAADSVALENARLDSIRIKAAGDSAAKAALVKKARSQRAAIITIAAIIGLLVLLVVAVLYVRNRKRPEKTGTDQGRDRFGNL